MAARCRQNTQSSTWSVKRDRWMKSVLPGLKQTGHTWSQVMGQAKVCAQGAAE